MQLPPELSLFLAAPSPNSYAEWLSALKSICADGSHSVAKETAMANDSDGHHTLKKKLSDHGKALFRQSQGVEGSGQISPSTSFTAPPPKRQSQPPPRMSMAGGQQTRARPAVRSTMPPIREERAGGPRSPPPLPGGGKPPPLPPPAKRTAPGRASAAAGGRGMLLNAITGFDASALKKTKTVRAVSPKPKPNMQAASPNVYLWRC